jgi:GR25 family glycosyltransferase involved in LPS biosynthesis
MNQILSCPAFVINLERSRDRYTVAEEQLKHAGYTDIRLFKGVDGQDQAALDEALDLFQIPIDCNIRRGELGCLLSHLKLFKHIIDHKIELTHIFEDDILFHPEWNTLCHYYYALTPPDYDILFMGNRIESCSSKDSNTEIITTEPVYCTHAYMITLKGAQTLLKNLLAWDYGRYYNGQTKFTGLGPIDIMIYKIQANYLKKKKNECIWYSWNGTKYPCDYNRLPLNSTTCKNSGLVFQNMDIPSLIVFSEIYNLHES